MSYEPFLTGSRAYGYPNTDSDIDLVVFLPEKLRNKLILCQDWDELNEKERQALDELYESIMSSKSLRFGKLNLICCMNEKAYDIWKRGTLDLIKKKPVPREFAIQHFAKLCAQEEKEDAKWQSEGE